MKSNNRNDVVVCHPEEVSVLLPPESTGTYMETTEALAVVDNDNHATNRDIITMNGTNTGNVLLSSSLCRSKCRSIDDIPDVARNMTWKDQFYEIHDNGSTDVIAAFDIDRTVYDRTTYEILIWYIWAPCISILALPLSTLYPLLVIILAIILAIYYVTLLGVYVFASWNLNETRLRIKRTHVAISTRGIYIDEADGHNLMRRLIVSYDKIRKCNVSSEYNCFYRKTYYKVIIRSKVDVKHYNHMRIVTAITPKYSFTLEGLQKPQKFVDIVNAMVERHTERTISPTTNGTTTDNCCREVIEVNALV